MTELFGPKGRYKYVMVEMLAEWAIPDNERGKVRENPLAAQGYLMVAGQSLKLAHERFVADRTLNLNEGSGSIFVQAVHPGGDGRRGDEESASRLRQRPAASP